MERLLRTGKHVEQETSKQPQALLTLAGMSATQRCEDASPC